MTEKPKEIRWGTISHPPIKMERSDALVVDALLRELGLEKDARGSER